MRHKIATMKLTRDKDHRRALKRNLAAALFISGRIRTTPQKARFVRGFVEEIITTAKTDDVNSRRKVVAALQDRFIVDAEETDVKRNKSMKVVKAPKLINKIFKDIAPKYVSTSGGYTRIIKLADRRVGDNSQLVYLELVDPTETKTTRKTRTGGNRRLKSQRRVALMNKLLKVDKKAEKPQASEAKQEAEAPKSE